MPKIRLRRFVALTSLCGGALLIAPAAHAAPASSKTAPSKTASAATLDLEGWNYQMADDELENRWSWRATIKGQSDGAGRVVFGWKDARNFALLQVSRASTELWQVKEGVARRVAAGASVSAGQTVTLQIEGKRVRVLRDNAILLQADIELSGKQFGAATQGALTWDASDVQPTEPVNFRDDFMRAQGPDDAEAPSEWSVRGNWQTSGAMRPRYDESLNPNPFVFRASDSVKGEKGENGAETVARAGRWFWSDYAVTASVRANDAGDGKPLVAALQAFEGTDEGAEPQGLSAEIDFRAHVARIKQGDKVLAQGAPFDTQSGQWHRVRFEPGPGTTRLLVDGIERVQAKNVTLAQGEIGLGARAGGANSVDFDDVWIAPRGDAKGWGEGSLPERFQKDRLMKSWASAAAAWKRGADGTWWHSGDFFGDARVSLPIPTLADGAGLKISLGAKSSAQTASAQFIVARAGDDVSLGFEGETPVKIPLAEATGKPLVIQSTPRGFGEVFSQAMLDGKPVGRRAGQRVAGGTKVGVTPLKNGAPLGAAVPQQISLSSATFDREGKAVIGVNITPVTEQIARENGLPNAVGAIVDNVEAGSPARAAGVQIGDVVVGVDGQNVVDVDTMKSAVGAVKPGDKVKIDLLRARRDGSGVDWDNAFAATDAMLDYNFTTAPTDWRAARGDWDVTERWTCSPQWSFFGGGNSDSPQLWSRFQTQGDWTLEAYLATPMDLTRGERSPTDLNVNVGGDGVNLASGYSFGFATDTRTHNTIWRGDSVAVQKPFELPPGVGETHQDWFYVRLEKRQVGKSVNFRWSVNGREIANYTDDNPLPDGGKLAFWSKNGGLMIASARLWNSGLVAPKATPFVPAPNVRPLDNALGQWNARGAGADVSALLLPVAADAATAPVSGELQIVNPQSGGDWTTYITRQSFSPSQHPTLNWDYKMDAEVKLNLYAKVGGQWREIVWSGGKSDGESVKQIGSFEAIADGQWHRASFDLLAALRANGLGEKTVEALAFAAPDKDYLRAGLGGNHLGARLDVRGFAAPVLVAKAE